MKKSLDEELPFFLFYVRIKVSETRLGIKRKVYEGKSNGEDEIKVSGKNGQSLYHTPQ